jgi:hypothetical protein
MRRCASRRASGNEMRASDSGEPITEDEIVSKPKRNSRTPQGAVNRVADTWRVMPWKEVGGFGGRGVKFPRIGMEYSCLVRRSCAAYMCVNRVSGTATMRQLRPKLVRVTE